MALADIKGTFMYPNFKVRANSTTTSTRDQSGDMIALRVQAPATGNLEKVRIRVGAVGATWNATVRVSFQTSVSGEPSGTEAFYRDLTITDGVTDNTTITSGIVSDDGTDTGALKAVTKGDFFFIVLSFSAYTSGTVAFLYSTMIADEGNACYGAFNDNGAGWTESTANKYLMALLYDDDSMPYNETTMLISNNTGTIGSGAEAGNAFTPTFKGRACGVWALLDIDQTATFHLYDTDSTTELASTSAIASTDRAGTGLGWTRVYFTAPAELAAGSKYYITCESGGNSIGTRQGDVAAAGDLSTSPGGTTTFLVTRATAGSGSFTETTTSVLAMVVLFDQLDDGASAGGNANILRGSVIS